MEIKQHIFLIFSCLVLLTTSANSQRATPTVEQHIGSGNEEIAKWIADLYEHGVRVEDDTLILSAHVQELLKDDELRWTFYPRVYSWEYAAAYMQNMKLKEAFWYLINLFPDDKELVMRTVLGYDELFEMDRALIAAFYTYGMLDPEVCEIINGQLEITRPDLVEKKLVNVNEMVGYVLNYRASNGQN